MRKTPSLESLTPKNLRLYHCVHDAATTNLLMNENLIQNFQCLSSEIGVYLNYLEPRQVISLLF